MAACVSRPPMVRPIQSVVPRERVDMELAMQLAALVRAHDADVAVVVDDEGSIVASVGPERPSRALAYFAGAMAHGRGVGSARSFESGRVHVEVVLLAGVRHVVAVKGDFFVHDPRAVAAFVRDAWSTEVVEAEEAIVDGQDDDADDDFDFDLDFQGDLRSVVG
jgi:hypothetical protein